MTDITPQWLWYPVSWSNEVEKIMFEKPPLTPPSQGELGRVWINSTQYFDWISQTAREFYIWWYQPAQKRLKDRKATKLSAQDIMHYMKICTVLDHTDAVMSELEKIEVF
jgi:hypothetical protein